MVEGTLYLDNESRFKSCVIMKPWYPHRSELITQNIENNHFVL